MLAESLDKRIMVKALHKLTTLRIAIDEVLCM